MLHFNYITCLAKKLSNNISAISEKNYYIKIWLFLSMYATVLSNYTFYYLEKLHIHTHAHTHTNTGRDRSMN